MSLKGSSVGTLILLPLYVTSYATGKNIRKGTYLKALFIYKTRQILNCKNFFQDHQGNSSEEK